MGAALWELRAVLQKNLSHERRHRNIQRQKITLYPKNKSISGLRESSSFQNWTKPGIFPRIWKFPGFYRDSGKPKFWSVLFLVVIQEKLQEHWISYWQKCENLKIFNASNGIFGAQKISVGSSECVWAAPVNIVSTIISLIKHIDSSYTVPYLETKLIKIFYLKKGCDLHGMV